VERSLGIAAEAAVKKNRLWAGVDLGVEAARVCVIDDAGEVLRERDCPSCAKDVRHALTGFRRTRFASVALEAGTGIHIARGLRNLGYPVELLETRQLSKFLRARRNKTDAGDARGIAEAGRISASLVSKVYLKSLDSQALQSRLAIRRHLVHQRVAAVNMLGRQIELFGGRLRCQARRRNFRSAAEAEIRKIGRTGPTDLVEQLRYLADHCERLIAYQRLVDRDLGEAAQENDVCRRFMGIAGVGPLCALTFYAAVDDPYRFSRTTDIGSYFGLAPRLHESGLGNRHVRALLVRAASMYLLYCKQDNGLKDWAVRLQERLGRIPSRVALARKLAVIMLAIWKSGDRFDPMHRVSITRGQDH
jgi:transposase